MNHDALFKQLLTTPTVLKGFFEAFLPAAARFVDFESLHFIDKEHTTVYGRPRTGDLLVRTRFRGEPTEFLIHLEHQAQKSSDLVRRMLEYFALDWRDSGVIDLPRMQAESYVMMANPAALALSARMNFRAEGRMGQIRDFLRTLMRVPLVERVSDVVTEFFFAYQPIGSREALQLPEEIAKVESTEMRDRIMEVYNPWIKAGIEQGILKGEVDLVLRQLGWRFGALSDSEEGSIRDLPIEKIDALAEALLDFTSRDDLAAWLGRNAH